MDIETIYQKIDEIVLKHLMLNDEAMVVAQSLGYNGFKRMHRINSKNFHCKHIKLENDMFDKYRKKLNVNVQPLNYSSSNIKYHLTNWKTILETDIKELGTLNNEHIKAVGLSNDVVECVLKIFMHDYEKLCRWIARFSEGGWNTIDIHLVDDRLHEKLKKLEEE